MQYFLNEKFLSITVPIIIIVYVVICLAVYLFQEKLIFLPERLSSDHKFYFDRPFEEITLPMHDGVKLSSILVKAEEPKGVIFYLHGNAGSLASWSGVATTYTALDYDVFLIDYRGYGKSEGTIRSEKQFMEDMHLVYGELAKRYAEEQIIVLGYSLGSGPAAQLAASNKPRMLILQAPYYSLATIARRRAPIVPLFLLKYSFKTYEYLPQCNMPVVLIHGTEDRIIPYSSSLRLRDLLKSGDTLITLRGLGHNGMTSDPGYQQAIKEILK